MEPFRPKTFEQFVRYADADIPGKSSERFPYLEPAFDSLVFDTSFITDTLNQCLSRVVRLPSHVPSEVDDNGMLIADGAGWQITLERLAPSGEIVYSYGCDAFVAVVGPQPLAMRRHSTRQNLESDVFDPSVKLSEGEDTELPVGSMFRINRRFHIDVVLPGCCTYVAKLSNRPRSSIRWAFSRTTLHALQPIAAFAEDANLVSFIRTLTAMRHVEAVPTLTTLTGHSSHFVRWSALQALLRLSPETARADLHRAASDPHPHIQAASKRAISMLAA